MIEPELLETISCPYCGKTESDVWAKENGFTAVKCASCGLIYVNPRPVQQLISSAVESGIHSEVDHDRTAIGRRVPWRIRRYRSLLGRLYRDVWERDAPISWLDVGAGYGEILEAVQGLAPKGSTIEGVEPMKPKAIAARERGLPISNCDLSQVDRKYEFVSLVNVFSHIPDFRAFMREVRAVTQPRGELLIETGNAGDLPNSRYVPTELDLPDHLVFAGEGHLKGYLAEFSYEIVGIQRRRRDGFIAVGKNIVKRALGRRVFVRIPYTSPHRSLMVRARLTES